MPRLGVLAGQPRHAGQRWLGPQHCKLWPREQASAYSLGGETRTIPPSGGVLLAQVHRNSTLHLGNVQRTPLAAPPSRVVRLGRQKSSSSCTSRKNGTGAGGGREQSPHHEGPGLGGVHASSPMLAAARESTTVNSGSDSAVATTPKGGRPAESSSSEDDYPFPRCCHRHLFLYRRAEWNAGHGVRWHSRITGELHRTAAAGGVKVPWGLARWKGSHCNPQIAQSTSRWFSAHGREASMGSDRRSPSHPREEREMQSQRCHVYTLTTNA